MSGSWTIHFQLKEAAPLFGVFVKILFSMVVNYFDWVPTEKILIVTPGVFLLLTSPKDLPPRWTAQAIPSSPVKQPTKHVIITLIDLSDIWNKQKIVALHLWYLFLSRPTLICSLIAAHPWRTTCNKRSFDQQKQKFFYQHKQKFFLSTKAKVFFYQQKQKFFRSTKAKVFLLTKAKVSAKLRLRRPQGEERRVCSHWRSPWEAGKVENPVKLNISRLTRREGQQGRVAIWKNVDC